MATESPIRMPGTSGKWLSLKEASTFAPPTSMVAEDLGLLLNGHKFHGSARAAVPNRSGSAPPSMEGSFLAIGNLISQQNLNADLESLNTAIANCESEEQLRADPAYSAYYCSNVNLNPRLPPPLISWENRRLVRHIGSFGNNWGLTSVNGKGNNSLHVPQGALSTHKEECEDDNTPQQPSDDQVDNSSISWPVQNAASLPGDHKDLVGLLQEQLSSDPSSMYSQSHSLSHGVKKESFNHDAYSGSSNGSPASTAILVPSVLGSDDRAMSSNSDHSVGSVSRSSSLHHTGSLPNTPPPQRGMLDSADVHIQHIPVNESEMKALNLSSLPNSGKQRNHEQWSPSYEKSLLQPQGHQQQINSFQLQNSKFQMPSQGGNPSFVDTDHYLYSPSKFSAEPIQQSSGLTPPLFATAAAYMTSANTLYPNHPAPFPPQYGVGGYPLNSNILPSYIAGYPQGTVPLVFDDSSAAGPSFHARTSDISTGGAFAHGGDTQHLNKLYGQLGYTVQPNFADPFYMAYYQQPFGEAYGMSGQLEPLVPHGGSIGNQVGPLNSQQVSDTISDQKFQHQRGGFMSNLNQQRGAMTGPNYFGSMSSMGVMQYPSPLHAGPIMPGSPISGTNLTRERKEIRFHEAHSRSPSAYSGWQGHRGYGNFEDPRVYNFLEDLKSGKGKRFELPDIAGHIVEFSADQHGSRFIQQKLENCSDEDKASVFKEVLPHAPKLMTDVFGNYVIQKFFEYGSPDQRRQLANQLAGHILPLSLQMYGCRVIQKALEVIELEQKAQLIHELDGHVMRCVRDQNGNHVIQKCIESVAMEKIGFIISAFRGQVANLSMHPYGCRVVQRVLEHCTDELQCQFIVDEILESVCDLAQDQYGNYVTQHVLERGKSGERRQIINKFRGNIVQLSQHKFASNVVEKCLEYGGTAEREVMIQEVVGHNEGVDNLLLMMKDQYANYVVQKVLETCPDEQRVVLLGRIRVHVDALKKYTYGKHIAARFEQLYDYGENEAPGS